MCYILENPNCAIFVKPFIMLIFFLKVLYKLLKRRWSQHKFFLFVDFKKM